VGRDIKKVEKDSIKVTSRDENARNTAQGSNYGSVKVVITDPPGMTRLG